VEERDAAILAVPFTCGLRKAEAVSLDMEEVDTATYTHPVGGGGHPAFYKKRGALPWYRPTRTLTPFGVNKRMEPVAP
jgi:site-specific recombinase XerC